MRYGVAQIGFSLFALLTIPFIFRGASTQAGFLSCATQYSNTLNGTSFDPTFYPFSGLDSGTTSGWKENTSSSPGPALPGDADHLPGAPSVSPLPFHQAMGPMGSMAPSGGNAGGLLWDTGQQPGLWDWLQLPQAELTGQLFLADSENTTPPFPSRLFRPPRLV